MYGLADATPRSTASTPPPTKASGLGTSSTSPKQRETSPKPPSSAPSATRRRMEVSGSAMSSLSAYTGEIRPVRRAGR